MNPGRNKSVLESENEMGKRDERSLELFEVCGT